MQLKILARFARPNDDPRRDLDGERTLAPACSMTLPALPCVASAGGSAARRISAAARSAAIAAALAATSPATIASG